MPDIEGNLNHEYQQCCLVGLINSLIGPKAMEAWVHPYTDCLVEGQTGITLSIDTSGTSVFMMETETINNACKDVTLPEQPNVFYPKLSVLSSRLVQLLSCTDSLGIEASALLRHKILQALEVFPPSESSDIEALTSCITKMIDTPVPGV